MRILSGVQPSGKLHIGNYFGAVRQFIELQHEGDALYFIADLHALTTVRDAARARELSRDVALDFLALGLDPAKATLFRQSDIPEVTELFWSLLTVCPMGLLERAVSYKDKLARGFSPEAGLFTYPVLQAADIMVYGADVVPVGKDQLPHLEITRDLANKFNLAFVPGYDPARPEGDKKGRGAGVLKLPRAHVRAETAVVPGLDGQKMSKSYGNTIDLFADDGALKKCIMGMKTDSAAVDEPKSRATPLYQLLELFAPPAEMAEIAESFDKGGLGYGHYKQRLLALFHEAFDDARRRRRELGARSGEVEDILAEGARRARSYAAPVMSAVRQAVGTGRPTAQ
ncbi:MAG TPA: tryptophan--tRNA ligase [Polyangiaceae bacterium]|nr:tryptophan--tRNA ligase [Polyangiaceae bacterium]